MPDIKEVTKINSHSLSSLVRLPLPDDAIHFAEWMDIVCVRNGRYNWRYNADNYTKNHTTKEMFTEWLKLTSNEA